MTTAPTIAHPASLHPEQAEALAIARQLAAAGVPLFVAPPALDDEGSWDPAGGTGSCGYRLPRGWQRVAADARVVDAWRPGWALAAVMGHGLDVLDVDPRNGGESTAEQLRAVGAWPRAYGRAQTPSGGWHDLVASLGVGTSHALPGVDLQGGHEGGGRGFVFIAPTVKLSKATGELVAYRWTEPPDLSAWAAQREVDESGRALAAMLRATKARNGMPATGEAPAYDGPPFEQQPPELQAAVERYLEAALSGIRAELEDAAGWPQGQTDERGRGWDKVTADAAMRLGQLARATWNPLAWDEAEALLLEAAPTDAGWTLDNVAEKWRAQARRGDPAPWPAGLGRSAADREAESLKALGVDVHKLTPAKATPAVNGAAVNGSVASVPAQADRPPLEVTNSAVCAEWLRVNLGVGPLAGMFNRGGAMVHTPRVGEDGYLPLADADRGDDDGPAQVRPIDAGGIAARVQYTYRCFKMVGKPAVAKPALFPKEAARIPVDAVDMLPNLRLLRGVTHTPLVRRDGTVLTGAGYDDATRLLHLPAPGLVVPPVPDSPTAADVAAAVGLLDQLLGDFPFCTPHDRANYLAALLTPLLRELVPPPYKLVAIGAPQPGSGKSLLATIARTLHGGVFRAETPEDDAEMRKQISSILDVTTGPVVQFDNVSGVLRSSTLSGLLTSARWDDRRLGSNTMMSRPNDRLWMITGNNLLLGGDLVRRTLWVTIDPAMPHPEKRTGFAITNLEQWVAERRGELVRALLVLVRAWVVAGRPIVHGYGNDGFARWMEATGGILANAGIPGVVGHEDSARQTIGSDDDEWETFLAAAHAVFGDTPWSARELLEKVDTRTYEPAPGLPEYPQQAQWRASHPVQLDDLPALLTERILRTGSATAGVKTLGMWLRNREGRFAGAYCVRSVPELHAKIRLWKVECAGSAGPAGSGFNPYARDFEFSTGENAAGRPNPGPAEPADPALSSRREASA